MPRPKAKAPSLRYHLSGQSVVTIDGKDYYLGKHDSPESLARYAVLIATYQAGGLRLPDDFDAYSIDARAAAILDHTQPTLQADQPIQIRHLTASYREHIKTKYASDIRERRRLNLMCDELDKHDGGKLAGDYGPLSLQAQRERWVKSGKSRKYVNRLAGCIVRMFKYAVSQELIDTETWNRLQSVESLRAGQTEAPDRDDVKPVSIEMVRETAKHLSPVLKAMVRVHVATGMRPSEVCNIRPCDIDRSGEVWMFRPAKHKTANKGKRKAVPIIGDAREAITDYLNRDPQAYCFSPAESVAWWLATKRANRKSKVQPSQESRAKENPQKQPGERYNATTYRQSIQRAAKRAKVEQWHPYQLRHLAGTVVRDALGIEAAQALLGHSKASMTEHYAKQNESKAIEAAQHAPKL
jgi:integrase